MITACPLSVASGCGTLADADLDLVDLNDVDFSRLVAHLDAAPKRLDIEGEVETVVGVTDAYASTHYAGVVLGAKVEPPHVEIELTNEFMEKASIATDLAGRRILHERPFEPPEPAG
ncbi:hypothetical protein [Nocardioides sp.]|uniref:hypothetical protein n=1 Tax=Nocardioides sp. TaxID=35761 RepID=UPI00273536CE|nr:hypothetical protein [Nocardioides sp.]MDP3894301.1 hypothetical protein [Nocardioides sp.]